MSKNEIVIDAPREAVFAVLADPMRYADWVMGAKRIRGADENWPEEGSSFYHAVGAGPVDVKDSTTVVEVDAPCRIVLRARARPVGIAHVTIDLTEDGEGRTKVEMEEHPVEPAPMEKLGALVDPLIHPRNAESLRRLKELVEQG